jgi:hypothetical protein
MVFSNNEGVIFINSEDVLDPLPTAPDGEQDIGIPCIMIKKNA